MSEKRSRGEYEDDLDLRKQVKHHDRDNHHQNHHHETHSHNGRIEDEKDDHQSKKTKLNDEENNQNDQNNDTDLPTTEQPKREKRPESEQQRKNRLQRERERERERREFERERQQTENKERMKKLEQFSEFLDDESSNTKDPNNNVEHLKEAKKHLEKEDDPLESIENVQGEEDDLPDDFDPAEGLSGVPMEPFNLKEERELGVFYANDQRKVRNAQSDVHDAWLDSVDDTEIHNPSKLKSKKTENTNTQEIILPEEQLKRTIIELLQENESVLQALRRLRPKQNHQPSSSSTRRQNHHVDEKNKPRNRHDDDHMDLDDRHHRQHHDRDETDDHRRHHQDEDLDENDHGRRHHSQNEEHKKKNSREEEEEKKRKEEQRRKNEENEPFMKLTSAADDLLNLYAYYNIYSDSRENILKSIYSGKSEFQSTRRDPNNEETTEQQKNRNVISLYDYKWSNDPNAETFGPFTESVLKQWIQQGYFAQAPIWIRERPENKERLQQTPFIHIQQFSFD